MSDWSWAAGLFEGEGCFTPVMVKGRVYPRAILAMADKEVVERFAVEVGCGRIRIERRSPRKDLYRWEVQARFEFDEFARRMVPLLGRTRQAAYERMMAKVTARERRSFARKR